MLQYSSALIKINLFYQIALSCPLVFFHAMNNSGKMFCSVLCYSFGLKQMCYSGISLQLRMGSCEAATERCM